MIIIDLIFYLACLTLVLDTFKKCSYSNIIKKDRFFKKTDVFDKLGKG